MTRSNPSKPFNQTPYGTTTAWTVWINGRVFCAACRLVRWVIAHPEAVIVCDYCGGPVVRASGDEV